MKPVWMYWMLPHWTTHASGDRIQLVGRDCWTANSLLHYLHIKFKTLCNGEKTLSSQQHWTGTHWLHLISMRITPWQKQNIKHSVQTQHTPQSRQTPHQLNAPPQGGDTPVPEQHNHGMPAKMHDTPPALRPLPTCPTNQERVLGLEWGQ